MFGYVGSDINSNATDVNTIGKCLMDVELTDLISNIYLKYSLILSIIKYICLLSISFQNFLRDSSIIKLFSPISAMPFSKSFHLSEPKFLI